MKSTALPRGESASLIANSPVVLRVESSAPIPRQAGPVPAEGVNAELAPRPRVLIGDDHPVTAEAISRLLAVEYDVIGVSSNGRRLLTDAALLKPDLIVLNVWMPELSGFQAARHLARLVPGVRLVFLAQQTSLLHLREILAAGGLGYVATQCASAELMTAVRLALAGRHYVTSQLKSTPRAGQGGSPWLTPTLTGRQRQVLRLVAEGKTVKEMSVEMKISPKTVEFHKSALMNQTGLRTTAELTRYAIASGVVGPNPLQSSVTRPSQGAV